MGLHGGPIAAGTVQRKFSENAPGVRGGAQAVCAQQHCGGWVAGGRHAEAHEESAQHGEGQRVDPYVA